MCLVVLQFSEGISQSKATVLFFRGEKATMSHAYNNNNNNNNNKNKNKNKNKTSPRYR